jgi:glycosyltransferase involved in cell wall biosynthesis
MHIVIDARMIDSSGIGIYLKNILDRLPLAYKITLLGDPQKLSLYRANVKIIPFCEPIYSIGEQFALPKLIPKCDVFWSPHYNIPLLKIKADKRLVTVHDVYHLAYGNQLSIMQRLYSKIVINAAMKISNHIITVSGFSKNEIIKYTGINSEKVKVIHNGVNTDITINHFASLKQVYNLPDKYILYVGNVKPHKNLRKMLESYLLLSETLQQQYKIVIAGKRDGFITGDKALFTWIYNTPTLSTNILFTGFVADKDMDTLYHFASAFVFPSLYEGFGFPPLEAMANGCPVLVSNLSCLPEICGNAAMYFDPNNAVDICNVLTQVLLDVPLKESMINKGKKRVIDFSWTKAANDHIRMFELL